MGRVHQTWSYKVGSNNDAADNVAHTAAEFNRGILVLGGGENQGIDDDKESRQQRTSPLRSILVRLERVIQC